MPTEYQEKFDEYRQAMIEKIVETDEDLLLQYLEGEVITDGDLRKALRQATLDQKVVPVPKMRGRDIPGEEKYLMKIYKEHFNKAWDIIRASNKKNHETKK